MPNFSLAFHTQDDVFICRVQGYLDGEAGKLLQEKFREGLGKGFRRFLLNLSEITVINSPGITQILELVESLQYDYKASLGLVGVSDLYVEVFQVVGILKMARAFPTEEAAAAGLE